MKKDFPQFRYHPDPLQTGAIRPGDEVCICCKQARGFIYVGPVYAVEELNGQICPWCIADGSAASKWDASFADDHPLARAGMTRQVIDEVTLRTPGYTSWQQDSWLCHCNDACEFHGDATERDVEQASAETKAQWMSEYNLTETEWRQITTDYAPGGDPAIYKFVCRHCGLALFGWDCS